MIHSRNCSCRPSALASHCSTCARAWHGRGRWGERSGLAQHIGARLPVASAHCTRTLPAHTHTHTCTHAHLCKVAEPQVRVLKQHPVPLRRGGGHILARHHLLPLPHGHPQGADLAALGEILYQLGGVGTFAREHVCVCGGGGAEGSSGRRQACRQEGERCTHPQSYPTNPPTRPPTHPPGDSRQMRGHFGRDSAQARSSDSGTDSTKRWPSVAAIKSAAASSVRSSRNALQIQAVGRARERAVLSKHPARPREANEARVWPARPSQPALPPRPLHACSSWLAPPPMRADLPDHHHALKLGEARLQVWHRRRLWGLQVVPGAGG